MASAVKRTRYRTPGVVNGSLAYDLDALERRLEQPEIYAPPKKKSSAEVIAKAHEHTKAMVRTAETVSATAVLGFTALTVMLVLLVFCCIELTALSNSVVSMQKELSALQAEQVTLQAQYDQAFDLAKVKAAAEEAGMVLPSDSQLYYIDISLPDSAEVFTGGETGAWRQRLESLGQGIQTAVEYFR